MTNLAAVMPDMSTSTEVHRIDPLTDPAWDQLITTQPSTVFHTPAWMHVLRDVHGFTPLAYIAKRDGIPVAGVPVVATTGMDEYRYVTLPFSDFCEIVGEDATDREAVANEIVNEGIPWHLRSRPEQLPEVAAPEKKKHAFYWHAIEISPELEEIEEGFQKSVRRSIRRAKRDGVTVVPATEKSQLRAWYNLQLRQRKNRHKLIAQPYSFFEAVWDRFIEPGHGVLLVAMLGDRMIGGEIDLLWQNTLYAKFAAVDLDYMNLRVNHLLTWAAIEFGKEHGLTVYDLGRTPAGQAGLVDFKRSFRPTEWDLYSATYGRPVEPRTSIKNLNQVMPALTALLTRDDVPDEITEQAGGLLYRYFV